MASLMRVIEPSRPKTANADISRGSVSRVPHAVVKTGVNKHKFSASTSSRVTGISRPAPSSSLASTIGPGAGPQPVTRPQTSFGNYHNIPATVKLKTFSNIRDGEVPGTVLGKRKGTHNQFLCLMDSQIPQHAPQAAVPVVKLRSAYLGNLHVFGMDDFQLPI